MLHAQRLLWVRKMVRRQCRNGSAAEDAAGLAEVIGGGLICDFQFSICD
jgi:hypothetical protein